VADEVCIVTFPTTHAALRAQDAAGEQGIPARMIPVPRGISADCNLGMEVAIADMERLRPLLRAKGIECDFVKWSKR